MAESHSRTELRRLVDEFGGLARFAREHGGPKYLGLAEAATYRSPLRDCPERFRRLRVMAWRLLPADARAGCASFREFVEKWTGKSFPRSLPASAESSADAILRYLCEAPTDQAPAGEKTEGGFWTVPDIASKFGLTKKQKSALQSRLKRWREQNKGASTWREVRDGEASRRDARFFYSLDAIRGIVDAIPE
ncbi:MAG: hypothetical protein RBS80_27650 [Thermoguttaceae bacterium]|jgi:hypothetical protein|nr:hypothetical protein [Thermoguttaceae bacterium]